MNTPVKLAAFAAGLAAVFAVGAGAGVLAGPLRPGAGDHDTPHASPGPGTNAPAGLQVTQDGYTLAPETTSLPVAGGTYAFRILGPDGEPVTRYTRTHDKDLHLIVVRRDLAGFTHVHPELGADGTWQVPLRPGAGPGVYRVFADFRPSGRDGGLTLGADLSVPGEYAPRPVPAAARTATVDGYTVTLTGDLTAGATSKLTLSVSRAGEPVRDLQPYLGAYGHLVALRAGDLAYLHVHPDGSPGDGGTDAGPGITFHAEVPTAGQYRLYLDFRHGDKVRTAEFTATAASPPKDEPAADHSHAPGHEHGS